jgi:uncharacterized membrane protein (UPF0127 family)
MYYFFKLIITFVLLNAFNLNGQNLNYLKTCVKEQHCFDTRVADNVFQRAKGLMGETNLPRDEGMLFIFPFEGKPGFWMKNTKIPLDILFINDEDIIVYSVKNAQPCTTEDCPVYKTTRYASKVLEINGGLSNELGIRVGDHVMYFMDDE